MKPIRLTRSNRLFPKQDLGVGMTQKRMKEATKVHLHEFMEIAIVEHGRGSQCYEQTECDICIGDVFVIRPEIPHSLRDNHELDLINLFFMDDGSIPMLSDLSKRPGYKAMFAFEPILRGNDNPRRRLHLKADQLKVTTSIMDGLKNALYDNSPDSTATALIHFLEIINLLCEYYETNATKDSRILTNLGEAISHIEAEFRQDIAIEDLAKTAHMSIRSFQRHFRTIFSTTPTRYIVSRRIEEARSLLNNGEESISTAAFKAGFNDHAYFTRAFAKEMGITPKRYQLSRLPSKRGHR